MNTSSDLEPRVKILKTPWPRKKLFTGENLQARRWSTGQVFLVIMTTTKAPSVQFILEGEALTKRGSLARAL
jgi:hypothetical protein